MSAPLKWLAFVTVGSAIGAAIATFDFAEGTSYMSDRPETCINCHVMRPQFASWERGRHHSTATCNDCHVPADPFGKWMAKSANGWHHSKAFTTGDYPETIRIKEGNLAIVEANCVRCHGALFHHPTVEAAETVISDGCTRCHAGVAHAAEHTLVPH